MIATCTSTKCDKKKLCKRTSAETRQDIDSRFACKEYSLLVPQDSELSEPVKGDSETSEGNIEENKEER